MAEFRNYRPRRKTPREKVADLLIDLGFAVSAQDLYPARGHWRSSPYADVYRWEGYGQGGPKYFPSCPDLPVSFCSWNTMTDCARYGITVANDGLPTSFEVWAKKPVDRKS